MSSTTSKIAIVLVRGMIGMHPDVRKTLDLLRIKQKHVCVVIDDNAVSRGMVQRLKDYATYGTIDEASFKEILDARGEVVGGQKAKDAKVDTAKLAKEFFEGKIKLNEFESKFKVKPFFRLHPPIGGFERKGIKMPYAKGGVLGDRKEAMATLLRKML